MMLVPRAVWVLCALTSALPRSEAAIYSVTQATVSSVTHDDSKMQCYSELGCFPMTYPWRSFLRPFPAPNSPSKIDTKIYYYSRTSPERCNITLWPSIALNGADFSPNRPATAFIIHGFAANGNASWLSDLKDVYLKRLDANVFLVDWGHGAQMLNYLQVASNTRIVGAEVGRFLQWLLNEGLNASSVHLMGHSLGSHISAYAGKRVPNIGRITAFDPAQPGFEKTDTEARLDQGDAQFVDILHTNSVPFIPLLGFGLVYSYGDVDFYINGGARQPGCLSAVSVALGMTKSGNITSIKDLMYRTVEDVVEWVGCSHGRSYQYFIRALDEDCYIWGQKSNLVQRIIQTGSLDFLQKFSPSLKNCTEETCIPLGLETPLYPARGSFSVTTDKEEPFCNNNDEENNILSKINKAVLQPKNVSTTMNKAKDTVGNSVKGMITKFFG